MKLVSLEVANFRGIRAASVAFSAGLNVLHGPNDLGKSTLAEAIRAALLVPTKSSQGKTYVGWDTAAAARVVLTFEDGGKLWRVRKTFGSGFQSVLDESESLDPPKFRDVAHGGGVEGRVRELLSWGIAPPGGKGQPTRPTSYLVTALLCRQGEVQSIFDASLAEDKDGTGKALVTKALGVLAKEPLVPRIVERLTERVDAIFTPGDKFKKSADSPLVRLQEQLKVKEERLRDLKDADIRGKTIEERVVTLQAERLQLLEQARAAEAAWRAAKERDARTRARADLQKVIDDCARSLAFGDGLISELDLLQADLSSALVTLDALKADKSIAAAKLKATQELLQAASEEVARATAAEAQSGQMAAAALRQRRAELEGRKVSIEALLKDVASAERSIAERSSLDRDLHDWMEKAGEAPGLIVAAQRAFEQATLSEKLRDQTAKQATAERFLATYESARSKEAEAAGRLATAEQALTAAIARRDRPDSGTHPEMQLARAELDVLRAVEVRLKVQSLRDQVADLQAHEGRATRSRDTAFVNRSKASQIEQEVSSRVLPTKEQIASWRRLEVDLAQRRAPAASMPRSPLVPLVAGAATGLIVALLARLAAAASAFVTMLAAVTASIVVGMSLWIVLRNKARSDSADHEGSRRLSERWALEVLPSLREARLPDLAAYEGAVADMERRRTEAQQLRFEAEKDDLQAAAASQAAASLEGRRAELAVLESQVLSGGVAADVATVEGFAGNLSAVRQRIDDGERRLESMRLRVRRDVDGAVLEATEKLKELRSAHDALINDVASARAQLEVASGQCDQSGLAVIRQEIDARRDADLVMLSVADASSALNQARSDASDVSTRVAMLRTQLDAIEPEVARLVSLIGEEPAAARMTAEADLAQILDQLTALGSAPQQASLAECAEALANARQIRAGFEARLEGDNQAFDSATSALSGIETAVADIRTEIASKQGELKAIDRVALESKRQAAVEDSVFRVPDVGGIPLATAAEALEGLKRKLEECDGRLNAAKGQLHLVAGHVGAEQLSQQ